MNAYTKGDRRGNRVQVPDLEATRQRLYTERYMAERDLDEYLGRNGRDGAGWEDNIRDAAARYAEANADLAALG